MKTKMGRGEPRAPSEDKELQEHLDVITEGSPRGLGRRRRARGTERVEATMRWAYEETSMWLRGGLGVPGGRAAGGNSSSARGGPPVCMNAYQKGKAVEPQLVLDNLCSWNMASSP
ncbi:hypothetical protein GSI_15326 [Ganoderma sinense ZZ0214-1]|uniref:Uncharacterized protein n=1 Tax=Ganoderma sinense ZZ0214-1 TaxID=1077348 RepID=A0A2G8RM92_9APHY|nr:hypothetical protein GSI_15326 [Ganoderma sinense ZZ0214-1]